MHFIQIFWIRMVMREKQSRIYETITDYSNIQDAFKTHGQYSMHTKITYVSLDASFCVMAHFILTEEGLRSNVKTIARKGFIEI